MPGEPEPAHLSRDRRPRPGAPRRRRRGASVRAARPVRRDRHRRAAQAARRTTPGPRPGAGRPRCSSVRPTPRGRCRCGRRCSRAPPAARRVGRVGRGRVARSGGLHLPGAPRGVRRAWRRRRPRRRAPRRDGRGGRAGCSGGGLAGGARRRARAAGETSTVAATNAVAAGGATTTLVLRGRVVRGPHARGDGDHGASARVGFTSVQPCSVLAVPSGGSGTSPAIAMAVGGPAGGTRPSAAARSTMRSGDARVACS